MRKYLIGLLLFGLLAPVAGVRAMLGTIDNTPAATLLLPYFEVDLGNPNGITTLFAINNTGRGRSVEVERWPRLFEQEFSEAKWISCWG